MDTKSGEQGSIDDKKQKRKRMKKILSKIQKQLEFYFSDSNLRKDRFIKQEMDKAEDGCIDISIIANFNRMRVLAKDPSLVVRAMENCALLEVSEDKKRVKRKTPLKKSKYNENELTVYVENLPHNVDLEMLTKMFSPCGNIAYISLPKYKYSGEPKGFAFVEFTTPDEAANACKLLDNPTSGKPLEGRFPVTRKGRLIPQEVSSKETPLKRKRETSETEEKSSKEEASGVGKVTKASKRKLEATQDVEEGAQLEKKAKKKPETSREEETKKHDRSSAKKGAETPKEQKSAKKRKQSGEDDHSASEAKSHKGQRLDFDAKGQSAQKDKSKRQRDDSISSVESSKEKSRKEAGIVGREAKRMRTDSEASGGEDGDKKKKRSRSRKHKKDELEAPLLLIRVIPKKKWLELKEEYLAIQKTSRQDMKKVLQEQRPNGHKQRIEAAQGKGKSTEPEFVPGVVLKINSDKPFASRKNVRVRADTGISRVAYIDLKDGDTSGYVRLESAEGATAVLGQASKLKNEDSQFEVALLSGEDEEAYWKKLKLDRMSKLNQARRKKKKRGVDRILDKTEKVLGVNKSQKGHKHFE